MAKIDIAIQAEEVQQRINQLTGAGADLTPAWQAVGNALVNRIRLGFRMSRSPWGATWQPIKFRAPRIAMKAVKKQGETRYVRRRDENGKLVLTKAGVKQVNANAAGKAGKPLVDKGMLRNSIVARATADGVEVGTNLKYAKVHQFGATIVPKKAKRLVFPGPNGEFIFARRVTVPARPYMPINQAGEISLPPLWAQNIIRTLAAHFKLGQAVTA
jgi:phage gpG-like protein